MKLKIKRVYDPPEVNDGSRILVDRLWPRGLTKAKAGIDRWVKDVAPSNPLRTWFGHDVAKWGEFRRRYLRELQEHGEIVASIQELAQQKIVTLLYGARDKEHNNAVVLKEFMEKRMGYASLRKRNERHRESTPHR